MGKAKKQHDAKEFPKGKANRSMPLVIAGVAVSLASMGLLMFVIANKIFPNGKPRPHRSTMLR